MSKGDNLKGDVNVALVEKQREIGLPEGGPNLWPGTAAAVAAAVYEPVLWQVIAMVEYLREQQAMPDDGWGPERLNEIKRALR